MKKSLRPELSVVVLNFNTKDLLADCLESLWDNKEEASLEIIVVDNGSADDSLKVIEHFKQKKWSFTAVFNESNLGFAGGNNKAREVSSGKYVLFLNTDTKVYTGALRETLKYLKENPKVGAISCRLEMPDGKLDPDARRAFPTPWVSFTHFSGLGKLFPTSKLFGKYRYGYQRENEIQQVDVIQAAFFLTSRKILDLVNWFDEDYFLDGEDVDLCWKIKEAGYKVVYFPLVSILHIKKGSKGKSKRSRKTVLAGVNAMETFYTKHLKENYPFWVNFLVMVGIKLMKVVRLIRYTL